MLGFFKKLMGGKSESTDTATGTPVAKAEQPKAAATPKADLSRAGEQIADAQGIAFDTPAQQALLDFMASEGRTALTTLLLDEQFRGNPHCSVADASAIYGVLAHHETTRVMEVGSGYSTMALRFTLKAKNLPAELISIDPEPRVGIGEFVDAQLFHPLQDVPVDDFRLLQEHEIVLFDTTHIDTPGGEVAWLFDEILPALPPGVIVGFHGVDLPREHSAERLAAGWNEQHRLLAWLRDNLGRYEVLFAGAWLRDNQPDRLTAALPDGADMDAATAFWIRLK